MGQRFPHPWQIDLKNLLPLSRATRSFRMSRLKRLWGVVWVRCHLSDAAAGYFEMEWNLVNSIIFLKISGLLIVYENDENTRMVVTFTDSFKIWTHPCVERRFWLFCFYCCVSLSLLFFDPPHPSPTPTLPSFFGISIQKLHFKTINTLRQSHDN